MEYHQVMTENAIPPIETIPKELVAPVMPSSTPTALPHAHFSWWALITISFIFLAGISAFLFWQNQALRAKLVMSPSPTATPIALSSADPTASWQTYTNRDLGFVIKYPSTVKVANEKNDQNNRFTEFIGEDLSFNVMLRSAYGIDMKKYFFMDAPIARTTSIAGTEANVYEMSSGYCDGGTCGKPFITTVTVSGPDLYHISFFGDASLSDVEKQILSTFKFTN